ncbi:MAG: DUF2703 domain-containing protein [Candidatus Bipolaricaulota bacterium]|nr:DUF2703 domain-containing protein [Candidatus Bipolaricaulota bacterium]MDW8126770.1 DUF2703 domain-containing protein [Candidatus Bipolaricaulota bacterium]
MAILRVQWVHFSIEGETCPRCAETGQEVKRAVHMLQEALSPLGVKVELEEVELTPEEFSRNPLRSNEIRLNGTLLEEWLQASTTQTRCCDVCGDVDCRAVEVEEQIHEIIPAELIVKAGLLAAAQAIEKEKPCCTSDSACCP